MTAERGESDIAVTRGTHRILANTAYRASADAGSKLISVVFFVVMARELGEGGFGVFVFGLSVAILLTALAGFGQDPVLAREVARDRTFLDAYFADTLALKLALALPVLLVAAAVMALAGTEPDTRSVVLLLGVALVAEQLANTCFAVYQAYEQLVYVPVVILSQRLLTTVAAVAALTAGAGVVAIAAIYLVGSLVATAIAFALLIGRVARPHLKITPSTWSRLAAAAAPIGVATVFQLLLFRVDIAILAFFEPDEVVGNYGAAFRLFEATLFLAWAVTTAVYPVLSRLTRTTQPPVGRVFEGALKLVLTLALPIGVGVALLAEPIVHLIYGRAFDEAVVPLTLLGPAIILNSIAFLAGSMLVAQHRQRVTAVTSGVVAALNIGANLILIPLLSLDGAALVALGSQFVLAAILLGLARGVTGPIDWRRVAAGPALAALLAGLIMLALHDSFAISIAGGTVAYVLAVAVWERMVFPEDARVVLDFLRRRG